MSGEDNSSLIFTGTPKEIEAEFERLTGKYDHPAHPEDVIEALNESLVADIALIAVAAAVAGTLLDGRAYRRERPDNSRRSLLVQAPFVAGVEDFGDGLVTAETDLAVQPSWSPNMVHGPDMLWAFEDVISKLIGDDGVEVVEEFRVNNLVRSNLKCFAGFGDVNERLPESYADVKPAVLLRLKTKGGKSVMLVGYTGDSKISKAIFNRSIDRELSADFGDGFAVERGADGTEKVIFDLANLSAGAKDLAHKHHEVFPNFFDINIVMEVVLRAINKFMDFRPKYFHVEKSNHAMASFRDVWMSGFDELDGSCKLELTLHSDRKTTSSGFVLYPFGFRLLKHGKAFAGGMMIDAVGDADAVRLVSKS